MTNAIAAAAMRCKTMADGSLRIEVEVEPKDAQAAFVLFGRPGAPMALAALKEGYAAVGSEPEPPKPEEKPKGGELAKWAAIRCSEEPFQRWLRHAQHPVWHFCRSLGTDEDDEAIAARVIRKICGITTRAELDSIKHAADLFRQHIRDPWQKHYLAQHA